MQKPVVCESSVPQKLRSIWQVHTWGGSMSSQNTWAGYDKCLGVPHWCGRSVILSKVMAATISADVKELCGINQLHSGLKAGNEGPVHAMKGLFEESSGTGWGLLLVDASNSLNSVSRVAAHEMSETCDLDVLVICSTTIRDMQFKWFVELRSMCSAERVWHRVIHCQC